jgi:hypothetical protein
MSRVVGRPPVGPQWSSDWIGSPVGSGERNAPVTAREFYERDRRRSWASRWKVIAKLTSVDLGNSGGNVNGIAYDPTRDRYYIGCGTTIKVVNPTTLAVVATIASGLTGDVTQVAYHPTADRVVFGSYEAGMGSGIINPATNTLQTAPSATSSEVYAQEVCPITGTNDYITAAYGNGFVVRRTATTGAQVVAVNASAAADLGSHPQVSPWGHDTVNNKIAMHGATNNAIENFNPATNTMTGKVSIGNYSAWDLRHVIWHPGSKQWWQAIRAGGGGGAESRMRLDYNWSGLCQANSGGHGCYMMGGIVYTGAWPIPMGDFIVALCYVNYHTLRIVDLTDWRDFSVAAANGFDWPPIPAYDVMNGQKDSRITSSPQQFGTIDTLRTRALFPLGNADSALIFGVR